MRHDLVGEFSQGGWKEEAVKRERAESASPEISITRARSVVGQREKRERKESGLWSGVAPMAYSNFGDPLSVVDFQIPSSPG